MKNVAGLAFLTGMLAGKSKDEITERISVLIMFGIILLPVIIAGMIIIFILKLLFKLVGAIFGAIFKLIFWFISALADGIFAPLTKVKMPTRLTIGSLFKTFFDLVVGLIKTALLMIASTVAMVIIVVSLRELWHYFF